jgi:hypothetical protein
MNNRCHRNLMDTKKRTDHRVCRKEPWRVSLKGSVEDAVVRSTIGVS